MEFSAVAFQEHPADRWSILVIHPMWHRTCLITHHVYPWSYVTKSLDLWWTTKFLLEDVFLARTIIRSQPVSTMTHHFFLEPWSSIVDLLLVHYSTWKIVTNSIIIQYQSTCSRILPRNPQLVIPHSCRHQQSHRSPGFKTLVPGSQPEPNAADHPGETLSPRWQSPTTTMGLSSERKPWYLPSHHPSETHQLYQGY